MRGFGARNQTNADRGQDRRDRTPPARGFGARRQTRADRGQDRRDGTPTGAWLRCTTPQTKQINAR
eukprot:2251120-Lingulodinium_polyedra.AAC.1